MKTNHTSKKPALFMQFILTFPSIFLQKHSQSQKLLFDERNPLCSGAERDKTCREAKKIQKPETTI